MSRKYHEEAIDYLKRNTLSERNPQFREAISAIDYNCLNTEEVEILKNLYLQLKDISLRFFTLKCLIYNSDWQLKEFFLKAYKKERYLDIKLIAVRGFANYATEEEINEIMKHFLKLLKKRQETTPYNYQEYELLRSACGLPYLINTYGYPCFLDVFEQVEKQYNSMPNAFKGHYTYDVDCNYVELRNPEETKKMLDDFFSANRY